LHGECRNCNHRNGFELGVFLKPFGHFEAGDFRQLNVHQDQIWPMLAREVKRLDPVASADSTVTLRFEEIVEELHVELVVFHDQDGFWHSLSAHFPVAHSRQSLARPCSGMIGTVMPISYCTLKYQLNQ